MKLEVLKGRNPVRIIAAVLVLFVLGFGLFAVIGSLRAGKYGLPEGAQRNPMIEEAYMFAKDHPDLLKEIPCYCGCANTGHRNNYDCYFDSDGKFIEHASLCGGCTGTTLDVKRMLAEGKSVEEMQAFIDEKYGSHGHE